VETWTFSDIDPSDAPIQRVGVNFGAPGDRIADNGTLWLEYPRVGGASPELDVRVQPENVSWFRRHSLRLAGGNLKWVEASGAKGLRSIRIKVDGLGDAEHAPEAISDERSFIVRLHFLEPDGKQPGQRVFDVVLGEQTVLKDFDIAAEARTANVGLMREFPGVRASEFITIALTPADPNVETVICGIEIVAEAGK